MTLTKDDARSAVEIGALATGSLAVAFPRLASRLAGAGAGDGEAVLMRMLGARSVTYGAVLLRLDDTEDAELLLMAGAASASADAIAALAGAARGKRRTFGALLAATVSAGMAGLACWALTAPK